MAGLQGAGKTTTAAKLAKRLIDKDKKRVMLVSVDVHRPAAILQLKTLADEVGAMHCPSDAAEEAGQASLIEHSTRPGGRMPTY